MRLLSPTIITTSRHQEAHNEATSSLLADVETVEKQEAIPKCLFVTAITALSLFLLKHLFGLNSSIFLTLIKGTIVHEKDMLYYENLAPLVRSYPSVHRVLLVFIHSSYSILISEFYPPISSPSFLSTFIHLKIRSTSEDINWSWSILKASTSLPQGIILYFLKP